MNEIEGMQRQGRRGLVRERGIGEVVRIKVRGGRAGDGEVKLRLRWVASMARWEHLSQARPVPICRESHN